ncbi:hypothetical protein Tco_1386532 [Tanacetum coccineum]
MVAFERRSPLQHSLYTSKTASTQKTETIDTVRVDKIVDTDGKKIEAVALGPGHCGRTRWKQTNTQRAGFYTENKPKEEHSLPKSRIASLAIRVLLIDPTAKNENPIIEDIQWSRSKAQGERCMRTRNSNFPNNSNVIIPRRRNRGRAPNIVEPELRTIIAPMAERTMEELLRAPTEGYGEVIVLPEINADHFEIKTNLLQLVQANPFHEYERENPHAHINSFKRITSTLRFRDVPNDVIKLIMFPYWLKGNARLWYEK